jgi:hypothetical protein
MPHLWSPTVLSRRHWHGCACISKTGRLGCEKQESRRHFRRNIAAKKRLGLKETGLGSLFGLTSLETENIVGHANMHSLTVPNTSEVDDQQPSLATFLDSSWSRPRYDLVRLKSVRHDKVSRVFARRLGPHPRERKSLCKGTPCTASKWQSPRVRLKAFT